MPRLTNVLEDTFDMIRLFERKVAQDSAEALRGIHNDGVEIVGEQYFGR